MAEASDFEFCTVWVCQGHHKIKLIGIGELSKILGFPYNISAMAGASDFKFVAQLGFSKAHHQVTRKRKGGRGAGLGKLPKIFWFHFNLYTMHILRMNESRLPKQDLYWQVDTTKRKPGQPRKNWIDITQ